MNKLTKKILGGTVILAVLATVGAVLVTADTDDTSDDEKMFPGFDCMKPMGGRQTYFSELTEEQQEEINTLREQLLEEDATSEEIREAINEKLAEFGIELPDRDDLLDKQIERTTQRLEILELKKQLREDGKSWDEIEETLADEYNITAPMDHHPNMMGPRGGRGTHGPFDDDFPVDGDVEDSDI